MTALYAKIFAERNSGASWLARLVRRRFRVTVMRGEPELDRQALKEVLQEVRSQERAELHNRLLDAEHDRILYSDFGWTATAPSIDVIRSAAHARDTLFVCVAAHPVVCLEGLFRRPKVPGLSEPAGGFAAFLDRPFPVFRRDGFGPDARFDPTQLWSAKMRALLDLLETDVRGVLLRAEEIADDPERTVTALAPHLLDGDQDGAPPATKDLPSGDALERLAAALPDPLRRKLRNEVDPGLMRALGYAPL